MNEKNKKQTTEFSNKGYTLTELLIVLAIIGMMATISWSNLARSRKNSSVSNVCNEVASMINKTRNYALSGKVVGGTVPADFSVAINGSSASIARTGETFAFLAGVTCDAKTFTYDVPAGNCISGCPSEVKCSISGGTSRTIEVSSARAVCK